MIPVILDKRNSKIRSGQVFNTLLSYLKGSINQEDLLGEFQSQKFEEIINYTANPIDASNSQEKCIAIRTNGVTDISTAAIEMNAVAARNTRCEDPAMHFVFAWPEFERPAPDLIFNAAEHAIKSLGLADHQYVLAVHVNTDNIHCHCAVNRIHPETYKSRNIEWAHKTIHLAARQSEIKHGWSHDNGIYIVTIDGKNQKSIVLNPAHDHTNPLSHRNLKQKKFTPTWHDEDSLESWLKFKVSKDLKQALPNLNAWSELHVWLGKIGIKLTDSGGDGMRVHASSSQTDKAIVLPASKSLRILKRMDLEKRWGIFTSEKSIEPAGTDLLPLPHNQITQLSSDREIENSKIQTSDQSKRDLNRNLRAAARADLRRRFAQYRRFVHEDDIEYSKRITEIRNERSQSIKEINKETKASQLAIRKDKAIGHGDGLLKMVETFHECTRRKLEVEVIFQEKAQILRATRTPPLVWREWLYEQSNLGDQAAISALRGIVYQARRDAKRNDEDLPNYNDKIADTKDTQEQQYRKIMDYLLAEEKKETAIRSSRRNEMRPYQVDALLVRHVGIQWHVTGNGNIVYSDLAGGHMFTDRGNRITFDREIVSDEDIRLALTHAKQKFGNKLTLTGNDPIFAARMAQMADEMGIVILNPELQLVIENHRKERSPEITTAQNLTPVITKTAHINEGTSPAGQAETFHPNSEAIPQETPELRVSQDRLRNMVLAIDPNAKFVIPDMYDSHKIYNGSVAAVDADLGFAQHLGRGTYVLHQTKVPEHHNNASISVQYHNEVAVVSLPSPTKVKVR
jgi:hypothetical protein